ncbi:hypothetical protein VNO77_18390 [Canavalia gladiata]|uniref:Uncharacterized protein n=1 Tax=Canavalia gladiata TaxID=3824 RepID=A0AAN9QNM9_CANGL
MLSSHSHHRLLPYNTCLSGFPLWENCELSHNLRTTSKKMVHLASEIMPIHNVLRKLGICHWKITGDLSGWSAESENGKS